MQLATASEIETIEKYAFKVNDLIKSIYSPFLILIVLLPGYTHPLRLLNLYGNGPDVLIVSYKDDATAFNGLKKGTIVGKGAINNRMTNLLFQKIESFARRSGITLLFWLFLPGAWADSCFLGFSRPALGQILS